MEKLNLCNKKSPKHTSRFCLNFLQNVPFQYDTKVKHLKMKLYKFKRVIYKGKCEILSSDNDGMHAIKKTHTPTKLLDSRTPSAATSFLIFACHTAAPSVHRR